MQNASLLLVILNLLALKASSAQGQSRQELEMYSMAVSAYTGVSGKQFHIGISRSKNTVRLRYGRLDSMQSMQLKQDSRFVSLVDSLKNSPVTSEAMGQRLTVLVDHYEVYCWDSISLPVKKNPHFVQLLDSVCSVSQTQLERKEANSQRIVVDGTQVHLLVKAGAKVMNEAYAYSPQLKSHPLLYQLLHESLQLYRQTKQTVILDVSYTSGY